MASSPRVGEVIVALRRLGFIDKPAVGDHISFFKLLSDHPCPCDGPITLHTGVDGSVMSKGDVARIKRQTGLVGGDLWKRVLAKRLPVKEYEEHLRTLPHADLVAPWFRQQIEMREAELIEKAKKASGPRRR